ncbi:Transposase and inactivated derivatives-like protein [Ochrobactrum soli]|uniref:Transposase and inactivated derivatives-like protein n=1 Tax=Ochrobactrum soli TaxID=2448455 RepID=A0A2P9HBH9_9HYPH|nr:Transposase and inactivated derivatives-like protein [[Ochrobactrum] soli]
MFKGHHFDKSVILLCVRWYLTYNLSLRNLKEMMAERGITMDEFGLHDYAPLSVFPGNISDIRSAIHPHYANIKKTFA